MKTQELKVTTLHGYVATNGEVESQNSVSVFPDVAGKVMETSVMLGSTVRKGDVIGYVDPNSPGSYFKRSPVYAPISGSVISIPLKNGTTVSTSTAICMIGDISNLQVSANVPERYVSVLKKGLKSKIFLEAYPDVTFDATVSRVSPVVDSTSRTKQVILTFDKIDSRVNAGMFAKFYVYGVNPDSTVTKREVELGEAVDGIVQVLKGVVEGERAVVQGQTSLGDGSKIQDITEVSGRKEDQSGNGKQAGRGK